MARFRRVRRRKRVGHASKATKAYVRKAMKRNEETKCVINTLALSPVPNVGIVYQQSIIPQGTDFLNRLGNVIKPTKYEQRYGIYVGTDTGVQHLRHIVFYDSECNGVVPNVGDVLQNLTPFSCYNLINVPTRFKIMSDKTYSIVGNATQTLGPPLIFYNLTDKSAQTAIVHCYGKKLPGSMHYIGPLAVANSLGKNAIFDLWINNSTTTAQNCLIGGQSTIYFKDA